jgi:hypothetical protein
MMKTSQTKLLKPADERCAETNLFKSADKICFS